MTILGIIILLVLLYCSPHDIQRILMALPKCPVYFRDVILSIHVQMSVFGFQGTVRDDPTLTITFFGLERLEYTFPNQG